MPRALEIPIEITRLDRAVDSVRRLSSSVRGVGNASRSSADTMQQSWSRAMERIARDQERYLNVSGPAQRLQRAQAAHAAAVAGGDPARIFDAQAAIARATVGMQRAKRQQALTGGGGFAARLTGVLASSRLNAGPISPLVGQLAEAAGIPMTGPGGAVIAGAAAAMGAFAAAVRTATDNLNQFGAGMRLGGGGAGDVAGAARYGFRGEEGAGAAGAFRARISAPGYAQMYAARYGIRALPEPLGGTNNVGLLRQGAEALRGITDQEERLRVARVFGLESALKYIDVSDRLNRLLDDQARVEERLAASGGPRAANELTVSIETTKTAMTDLVTVLGAPAIQSAAVIFQNVADQIQRIAGFAQGGPAQTGLGITQGAAITGILSSIPFVGPQLAGAFLGTQLNRGSDHTDAVKENTQAHRDTQKAFQGVFLPPGTYGGGARTAGAIPAGWSGDYLARQMESGALGRGAMGR